MNKKTTGGLKIITINRKASFNYFFKEIIEAGIVLKGSEIKSVRSGKINIADSYAIDKGGEIFLINSHIPIYKEASYSNHNPYQERKLLLNKKEIKYLSSLGMIIGSHSESHTLLSRLSYKEQFKEIKNSKIFLEKIINNIIDSISILIDKKLDLFSSTVNNQ